MMSQKKNVIILNKNKQDFNRFVREVIKIIIKKQNYHLCSEN